MSEIIIYTTKDGHVQLEVNLEHNTLWLSQQQLADLFGTKRQAITKHLKNIFLSGELDETTVCSKIEHTAIDGKKYKTKFYSLDAVISVGYRVNSNQATKFRIWATEILKKHLISGYTTNKQRLAERGLNELQQTVELLQKTLVANDLVTDVGKDHPFTDGNKRISCLIFLLYLKLQNIAIKFNKNGLVALALLIAQSAPSQKDIMVRLTVNLLID